MEGEEKFNLEAFMKPAQPPSTIKQNLLCELTSPSTPEEAILINDCAFINQWGKNLAKQWNESEISIKALATLGTQTLKFIQCRRKLLRMDYGRPTDSKSSKSIVYPLD